jgi:hypothetical protein
VTGKFRLRIAGDTYRRLNRHLFPGDRDEHGAVLSAGHWDSGSELILTVRELFIAKDGIDYLPGTVGYRALSAPFVARNIKRCADDRSCYLAVHCHGGNGHVSFSNVDLESHQRGYPPLLDITGGLPVGALVLADDAMAGSLWTPDGTAELLDCTVLDAQVQRVFPSQRVESAAVEERFARQGLMFGAAGQRILSGLTVGVVGLGGSGSLINQFIAHLGVGRVVAIDFDRIGRSNLARVVGATEEDLSADSGMGRLKVQIAERVARLANPSIEYFAIAGDIRDMNTARLLRGCDFVFLAADGMQPRLIFNALCHQYLIPGAQVGVKVRVAPETGAVDDITVGSRLVLPSQDYGCLYCHGWISSEALQREALSPEERRAQRYVEGEDVEAPSVISLNALATSHAVNDFLFLFTGLFARGHSPKYWSGSPRDQTARLESSRAAQDCLVCSCDPRSRFARADMAKLPCREA